MKSIIVEGIDRLGKDSLIDGIMNRLGYFQTVHYQKPMLLDYFLTEARRNLDKADDAIDDQVKSYAFKAYQQQSFASMMGMLCSQQRFIMNRSHLGEYVYAPRYRGYDGNYVFDLEKSFINESCFHMTTLVVLLHTSDFSFVKDDGLSFDFDKKEEEQHDFIKAFERSNIEHKVMIDVSDGNGNFVPKEQILDTVIKAYNELPTMQYPIMNVTWERLNGELHKFCGLMPDPKKLVS